MKKSILTLFLLVGTITAQADDYPYLTFETNSGEIVSVEFASDLTLVFSSTTLKIGDQVILPLNDLKKIYFSTTDLTTGIHTVVNTDDFKIYGYYDLQGRPVEQPEKGVYIMKTSKGNKKVIVK